MWRREPGLFKSDSERSPLEDDNAVAQIDQQRRDLGDLDALTAQANHAQQVATRARQDYEQYVREHRKEILEELRPTSEQKAAAYNAAIDTAVNEGQAYIDLCKRLMNVAAIAGPNTRIPALDHASTLMRDLRDRPLPPPELMG